MCNFILNVLNFLQCQHGFTSDCSSLLLRLLLWRVLTTAGLQMWVPGWKLSRRSWIFQIFQQQQSDLFLKHWNLEESAVSTRLKSEHSAFISCVVLHFWCYFYYVSYLNQSSHYIFRISEEDYVKAIKEEINKVVKLQEELDIDVLVHGEPEVSSHCK